MGWNFPATNPKSFLYFSKNFFLISRWNLQFSNPKIAKFPPLKNVRFFWKNFFPMSWEDCWWSCKIKNVPGWLLIKHKMKKVFILWDDCWLSMNWKKKKSKLKMIADLPCLTNVLNPSVIYKTIFHLKEQMSYMYPKKEIKFFKIKICSYNSSKMFFVIL